MLCKQIIIINDLLHLKDLEEELEAEQIYLGREEEEEEEEEEDKTALGFNSKNDHIKKELIKVRTCKSVSDEITP